MDTSSWQWNEIQQVGTDYNDITEVEKYDKRMAGFRDVDAENTKILELLNLDDGAAILELGTGTGRFSLLAARNGFNVTAFDVSQVMLLYAAEKVEREGLKDMAKFCHSGFLGLDIKDSYDAVVSGAALHHLPDTWKFVAVNKIYNSLKSGGQFILRDVVFSVEMDSCAEYFERFVNSFPENTRKEAARHAAQEYSTLDWIMTGILERAGFEIISDSSESFYFKQYHCRKP